MKLDSSIMDLKGIGEKNAALFSKLNIVTIEDLLHHFPRDYVCYPDEVSVSDAMRMHLYKGAIKATVVSNPLLLRVKGLSMLKFSACDLQDNRLEITYFNSPYLKKVIKAGSQYIFYGSISEKDMRLTMSQPKMYKIEEYQTLKGKLLPVYPRTKGLTDQTIAKYVRKALDKALVVEEFLPSLLIEKYQFPKREEAFRMLHFPKDEKEISLAQKRFSYEEFLLFLFAIKKQKTGILCENKWHMIETADPGRLIEKLPYTLTTSQKEAYEHIKEDMLSDKTMNRLLQGDVGSGKTIVALLAMLLCVSNGYQSTLMAPTEVLAKQHFALIKSMTKKYDLPFAAGLLVGSQPAKEKKNIYEKLKVGEINILIGTHAVIQEGVMFQNLALVITDEQHRFGVKQRDALLQKGNRPHTMVMSATPIPRSLAMILYGDLDISEMKEVPAKRLPIKNCVVDQKYRPSAYHFMKQEIMKGHQCYIICPMAEPGIMDELENVVEYASMLRDVFPETIQIAYLHGKMKAKQKNEIMKQFADGKIDLLVSTTVIEVGIDVPNATVMMVENAERFGLATLHQIRGRVGRSDLQSYCIFMESTQKKQKNERLSILEKSNDGFVIASEDLKKRGPGDMMGLEQSGAFHFRFADIYRDSEMLKCAAEDVAEILKKDSLLFDESLIPLNKRFNQYIEAGFFRIL